MTTTTVRWPEGLRGALQNGKSRQRAAGFRQSDPAGGSPFFESFSDDVPTTWSFTLRFNRAEAVVFQDWFRSPDHADYGNSWFLFPIGTEYGLDDHECHFTANGVPNPATQAGNVFTYQVGIITRRMVTPTDPDFTIPYFERHGSNLRELEALDRAINIRLPEA